MQTGICPALEAEVSSRAITIFVLVAMVVDMMGSDCWIMAVVFGTMLFGIKPCNLFSCNTHKYTRYDRNMKTT